MLQSVVPGASTSNQIVLDCREMEARGQGGTQDRGLYLFISAFFLGAGDKDEHGWILSTKIRDGNPCQITYRIVSSVRRGDLPCPG